MRTREGKKAKLWKRNVNERQNNEEGRKLEGR